MPRARWRLALRTGGRPQELRGVRRRRTGRREAHKFIRDAAALKLLLVTREREFEAWRACWRATLEGVYAGKVALLPGLERDLLAAWRPQA
jgi:hypothetical protein